jgi:hypothetical protein
VYEGEWEDGMMRGNGKMTHVIGNMYEGEWKDDKKHGRGKYAYANGGVLHEGR